MQVEKVVVGMLQENCYIVTKNNKSIIIDPGDESAKIIDACKDKNIVGILITHHHFDHIGALKTIEDFYHLKESTTIDSFNIQVIKTPGHTEDSLTYYFPEDKVMFTGDFIFKDSIGRTDLPTGNMADMVESLKYISEYPHDIKIYPGHGDETILGNEIPNFEYYLK